MQVQVSNEPTVATPENARTYPGSTASGTRSPIKTFTSRRGRKILFATRGLLPLVVLLGALSMGRASGQCPDFNPGVAGSPVEMGVTTLSEISGIVASRRVPGVFWVHNDSGDSARIFALDQAGVLLGTYNLTGVSAIDWEDIALGPGPVPGEHYIYVGDIGDNNAIRTSTQVYRIVEPTVALGQTPVTIDVSSAETFEFVFDDGPRDAEVLLIDPLNGDLLIVSKRESSSRVYLAQSPLSSTATNTLLYQGNLSFTFATAGDVSPDGDAIIVKSYFVSFLWPRAPATSIADTLLGVTPCMIPHPTNPPETQGEAVSFDAAGIDYVTIGEFVGITAPRITRFERIVEPPPPPPLTHASNWTNYE